MSRIERPDFSIGFQSSRSHNIQPEQLIPGAQFKRTTSGGYVHEFTIVNGPYSDVQSKKSMVNAKSSTGYLNSHHLVDLGVVPYENDFWNPSILEKIGE